MSKTCKKCQVDKPLTEFYTSRNTKDGRRGKCKPCTLDECREYAADPVNVKRKRALDRMRGNKGRSRESIRRNRLWSWHRLTMEQFGALLAEQGDRCAICGTGEPGGQGTWHVDHNHACCPTAKSCGKCVRGLLCSKCNVLLGMAKDDPDVLRKAADYLDIRGKVTSSDAAVH